MVLPKLTLILGGAASGKSHFAERLAIDSGISVTYVATAEAKDAEMRERIDRHRYSRPKHWRTIEVPLDVAAILQKPPKGVILLDCATVWLSNQFLRSETGLVTEKDRLLEALNTCSVPVIVVSNEVGTGIVPTNSVARSFREAQGRLNIDLAAIAELVVLVVAGLPQVLKGEFA